MDQDQPDAIYELNLGRYKGEQWCFRIWKMCNLGNTYCIAYRKKIKIIYCSIFEFLNQMTIYCYGLKKNDKLEILSCKYSPNFFYTNSIFYNLP